MGSWVSTAEECMKKDSKFSCKLPDNFEPDSDIAGFGVLLAFFIGAALTVIPPFCILVIDWKKRKSGNPTSPKKARFQEICEEVAVSLSETQIVTSVAFALPTLTTRNCKVSAYHYNIVCYLIILSFATHVGSIGVVHNSFKRPAEAGIRLTLIILAVIFGGVVLMGRLWKPLFPVAGPDYNLTIPGEPKFSTGLVLPASCFLHDAKPNGTLANFTASTAWLMYNPIKNATAVQLTNSSLLGNGSTQVFSNFESDDNLNQTLDQVFSLGVLISVCIVLVVKLGQLAHKNIFQTGDKPSREEKTEDKPRSKISLFSATLTLAVAIATVIYVPIRCIKLHQWMQSSGWLGEDNGEQSAASYGQFMAMVLMAIPLISFLESVIPFMLGEELPKSDD